MAQRQKCHLTHVTRWAEMIHMYNKGMNVAQVYAVICWHFFVFVLICQSRCISAALASPRSSLAKCCEGVAATISGYGAVYIFVRKVSVHFGLCWIFTCLVTCTAPITTIHCQLLLAYPSPYFPSSHTFAVFSAMLVGFAVSTLNR